MLHHLSSALMLNALICLSPQIGLSSFHQQAIHFLCADLKWGCQIWDNFSSVSPDLRLSLVTWAVDGWSLQQSRFKEVIQRVLQVRCTLLSTLQRET